MSVSSKSDFELQKKDDVIIIISEKSKRDFLLFFGHKYNAGRLQCKKSYRLG